MRYVLTTHRGSIIEIGGEFYVYRGRKLERVCPSEGMAREVFAGIQDGKELTCAR